MDRREFSKAVALLPVVPALPSTPAGSESEQGWEFTSGWMGEWGRMMIIKNGEVVSEYDYEEGEREMWRRATRINANLVAQRSTNNIQYVDQLEEVDGVDLYALYIDAPYFSASFQSEDSEAHIRQGKYSEQEYVYSVEMHTEEALRGVDDGAESLEKVIQEVDEFISD